MVGQCNSISPLRRSSMPDFRNALLSSSCNIYLVHKEEDTVYNCTQCTKSYKNRMQFKQHTFKLHKIMSCNNSNNQYIHCDLIISQIFFNTSVIHATS